MGSAVALGQGDTVLTSLPFLLLLVLVLLLTPL
jgi:hypothetical protein